MQSYDLLIYLDYDVKLSVSSSKIFILTIGRFFNFKNKLKIQIPNWHSNTQSLLYIAQSYCSASTVGTEYNLNPLDPLLKLIKENDI